LENPLIFHKVIDMSRVSFFNSHGIYAVCVQPCVPQGWCGNRNDWCSDRAGMETNAAVMGRGWGEVLWGWVETGTTLWMLGGDGDEFLFPCHSLLGFS